ncbi:hypothetical protein SAMN05444682_101582 [Parapedobacter indicus]|uniref:Uncharacterized protein n=1 Tax=Parapedobacter indicus TaxID=1477437 RepID=A0A1I3DPY0_9SPHI|nr:hypothetical protein CLV26_101596 [Parapedobacter indicus]SFH88766.1 hypothetical protein SAMN05444682_101582 [Parapedobacter indicus]
MHVSFTNRLIKNQLSKDVFNHLNETFPKEERLLEHKHSASQPAQYSLKGGRPYSRIKGFAIRYLFFTFQ